MFDVALKFDDGYDIYEVKFLKSPMEKQLMEKEVSKILSIPSLKVRNVGLISSSGFGSDFDGTHLIKGEDIYNP